MEDLLQDTFWLALTSTTSPGFKSHESSQWDSFFHLNFTFYIEFSSLLQRALSVQRLRFVKDGLSPEVSALHMNEIFGAVECTLDPTSSWSGQVSSQSLIGSVR